MNFWTFSSMKTSAQFWAKSRVDNNVIKDFPNKKLFCIKISMSVAQLGNLSPQTLEDCIIIQLLLIFYSVLTLRSFLNGQSTSKGTVCPIIVWVSLEPKRLAVVPSMIKIIMNQFRLHRMWQNFYYLRCFTIALSDFLAGLHTYL